jgi:hypothetical protein
MKCAKALSYAQSYFADHFMFTSYNADWIYRCYSTIYGFSLYGDPALGVSTEKTDTTPPSLTIEIPKGNLYILAQPVLPLPGNISVVIGKIPIVATSTDEQTGVASMELWINDALVNTSTTSRLEWLWDEQSFFQRHTIRIVTTDTIGNRSEQEQIIYFFNL